MELEKIYLLAGKDKSRFLKPNIYGIIYWKMGDITIKIPQKVNRSFQIDSRKSADEIIAELERRSAPTRNIVNLPDDDKLSGLRKLAEKYRTNPSPETVEAIRLAESWREKWNR